MKKYKLGIIFLILSIMVDSCDNKKDGKINSNERDQISETLIFNQPVNTNTEIIDTNGTMDDVINYGNINPLNREIKIEELCALGKDDIRIIRNTIYAKYGYSFKSSDLIQHFNKFAWYNASKDDVTSRFTEVDTKNKV